MKCAIVKAVDLDTGKETTHVATVQTEELTREHIDYIFSSVRNKLDGVNTMMLEQVIDIDTIDVMVK